LNFHPWKEDKFRLKSKGKINFLFLARMIKERDVQCENVKANSHVK